MTCPSFTRTQPTRGLGCTCPQPARASSRARLSCLASSGDTESNMPASKGEPKGHSSKVGTGLGIEAGGGAARRGAVASCCPSDLSRELKNQECHGDSGEIHETTGVESGGGGLAGGRDPSLIRLSSNSPRMKALLESMRPLTITGSTPSIDFCSSSIRFPPFRVLSLDIVRCRE